jgi:hypothetical protein
MEGPRTKVAIEDTIRNLFNKGSSGLMDDIDGDLIDRMVDSNLNFTFTRVGSTEGAEH